MNRKIVFIGRPPVRRTDVEGSAWVVTLACGRIFQGDCILILPFGDRVFAGHARYSPTKGMILSPPRIRGAFVRQGSRRVLACRSYALFAT